MHAAPTIQHEGDPNIGMHAIEDDPSLAQLSDLTTKISKGLWAAHEKAGRDGSRQGVQSTTQLPSRRTLQRPLGK